MVSMKPGSGTKGLDLDYDDYAPPDMVDGVQGRVGVGLLKDKIEEALLDGDEGDQLLESLGVDPSEITEVTVAYFCVLGFRHQCMNAL